MRRMQLTAATAAALALLPAFAGTAAAQDVIIPESPVLVDNTVETPNSIDPLGVPVSTLDGTTYIATLTNPNSGPSKCGIFLVGIAGQTFPTDWDVNTESWDSYPDAVPAGETKTYTIELSPRTEYMVYGGCSGENNTNSGLAVKHIYAGMGVALPGFGSLSFDS